MFSYLKGRPVTYAISSIYGFLFALSFVLYGGVKVILSFLDHTYDTMSDPIIFTILGLLLMSFAIAYRDLKNWGWYGLIGVNAMVILLGLISISKDGNIAVVLFSAAALYGLLAPSTRECLSGGS